MENLAALAIPALLTVILVRTLFLPMKLICKIALHTFFGLLCLWLLNTVSGFTGICFPINAVTVLLAGVFGVPGMGIIALLEML